MNLPQARRNDLLTTELEDEEVVVYDPERKQAHSLNRAAVAVWNHCDGQTSIGELQRRASAEIGGPISEAAIWLAIRKLERAHLLVGKMVQAEPVTRRQLLGKAGRVGTAAMVITPIVLTSNVLPAAAACSTCGTVTGTTQVCACGTQLVANTRQGRVCVNAAVSSTNSCTTTTDCTPSNVLAICVAFDGVGNCHVPCTGPNPLCPC